MDELFDSDEDDDGDDGSDGPLVTADVPSSRGAEAMDSARLGLRSHEEWKEWSKSGQRPSSVPANPARAYKDKGWVSSADWMGYKRYDHNKGKTRMLPFKHARKIVRKMKLKSHAEWKEWSKSGRRPVNVPAAPSRVYKDKGWISYPDWMGYQYTTGDECKRRKKAAPFELARDFVRQLKLRSHSEWKEWCKSGLRPGCVPSDPRKAYKGKGWLNLTSQKEWQKWSRSSKRPSNVPASPWEAYKDKGWVSWPDWMGYEYTKGAQSKKRKR
eukprot:g3355.t1